MHKKTVGICAGVFGKTLLEDTPTRTDYNGLHEKKILFYPVSRMDVSLRSFTRRTASFGRTKIRSDFLFHNLFFKFFNQRHKYNQRRV